jgi:hypothetical protein
MNSGVRRTFVQGLIAGGIGFGTVVLVFALANVLAGRSPFYTSALLGAALFTEITDPAMVEVTPSTVLAYNGVHLMVYLAFGVVAAALASLADRGRQLWYVSLFFYVFVSFHLYGAVQAFAAPMRPALSDVAIWLAGGAASVAMAAYLLWMHPRMRARQSW